MPQSKGLNYTLTRRKKKKKRKESGLSLQNPDDTLSHSTCYIYITTAMNFAPVQFQETNWQ